MVVDVKGLYDKYPIDKLKQTATLPSQSSLHRICRNSLIRLKYRDRIWRIARQINYDLSWFNDFRSYWSTILKGRPLWGVQDFYFLKNLYRVKFQESEGVDTNDPHMHLKSWQKPELIYQLFHQIYKESIHNQLFALKPLFKMKRGFRSILEFGCGSAPITTSLFEFYKPKKQKIYISDIQTLSFHYAAYKFSHYANVYPILLHPEDNFQIKLDEEVDAIFCVTVFEHLNDPLRTVKHFHSLLSQGGLLFFDYLKSEAKGLDTKQGLEQRDAVLDFINNNFSLMHGAISKNKNMNFTVVKKK